MNRRAWQYWCFCPRLDTDYASGWNSLDFDIDGLVVIVGNYGSGKTEVSINLAIDRKMAGMNVRIADVDLVNPYFRTREAKTVLNAYGIEVILPPERYLKADLPILSPAVSGIIRSNNQLTILDVGGDGVGATILAALADAFAGKEVQVLQVVNPFRPYTETIEGCQKIREEIENQSKLKINGIVGNANLLDETAADHIISGYEFVSDLSEKTGTTLKFITAAVELLPEIKTFKFACPVLSIYRQLVPRGKWQSNRNLTILENYYVGFTILIRKMIFSSLFNDEAGNY